MADRRVVEVEVAAALADLAIDVLWQAQPSAVALEDRGPGTVRLTADVLDLAALDQLPAGAKTRVLELDSAEHLDAWRAWAVPVRAGQRVVLHPAWLPRPREAEGDRTIVIDPGRAFGSGSHPSTRLVIAAIEGRVPNGCRVLDVGTGSGVLAIASCLLGAAEAVGIDVDPAALETAPANAAANGVAERVHISGAPLADLDARFALVLANIGAAVLCSLAGELARSTEPGGLLVLSGLLDEQVPAVVARFPRFMEIAQLSEEGWSAVVLCAPH